MHATGNRAAELLVVNAMSVDAAYATVGLDVMTEISGAPHTQAGCARSIVTGEAPMRGYLRGVSADSNETTALAVPDELRERVMDALHRVIDPELGIDVVELGLVYGLVVSGSSVQIDLTMTTPACPLGEQIMLEAQERVGAVPGVTDVAVKLVWDPPWTPDRMSTAARAALGWSE